MLGSSHSKFAFVHVSRSRAARRRIGALRAALLAAAVVSASLAHTADCADTPAVHVKAAAVDDAAIEQNAKTTLDWLAHGLDNAGTRFSKLTQIDAGNVKGLGLVWTYDLASQRGVESTPIVADGILYVTAPWSVVHAIDGRTGKKLWTFDPEVSRKIGFKACCDVVNRGVALYKGKVYVGSFDGRLIALDAATGKKLWETDTIIDHSHTYTITGAPRVIHDKVIIGNGGAEYGVRGYLSAYDVEKGGLEWRWFSVPGDPSKPFEDTSMALAAKTWDPGGKYWENGGGGTMWNSMVYDAELNLLYVGTGNGSPWNAKLRSPKGGDNLFLASIVALDPDTGKYVWHYQETPGDNSDYTSAQDLILADLVIGAKPRKVILHAPKNGFFFVIDRTNGKFISAKPFTPVNWAKGYDKKGRPIETSETRPDRPFDSIPGPFGGHDWQSMSYNPELRLAYIPAQHIPIGLAPDPRWERNAPRSEEPHSGIGWNLGMKVNSPPPKSLPYGRLVAWDPVSQAQIWKQDYPAPWNGGTLTTAGNLVFQGTADGRIIAFDAKSGAKLWQSSIGQGAIAAPVTYMIDGKQYVTLAVGWGGVGGLAFRATDRSGPGTIFTYALGGNAPAPNFAAYPIGERLSGVAFDPADVPTGQTVYVNNCVFCHGVPGVDRGGALPNLGYVGAGIIDNLDRFVFNGPFVGNGMPDFTGKLTNDDVKHLKAFIQGTVDATGPKEQSVSK